VSLALQILVARLLGIADYGRFAILYGVIVLASGVVTGLVGDALIVLDRADRRIRAGLEVWLAIAAATSAAIAAAVAAASGFASPAEAGLFALAMVAFVVEEIVRRLLMAGLRLLAGDRRRSDRLRHQPRPAGRGSGLQALSLGAFLGVIAAGQTVGAIVGWRLVPRSERVLVGWRGANLRTVWGYGAWRGLQQTLRPAMLTGVRVVVLAAAGAAAVGMLEAARTYTSPLLLVVGGLSSFLFVRFADHRREGRSGSLREADRVVLVLVGATVLMSAVALGAGPGWGRWRSVSPSIRRCSWRGSCTGSSRWSRPTVRSAPSPDVSGWCSWFASATPFSAWC
jgi:O-antigen/teichoic acid export membrane protein